MGDHYPSDICDTCQRWQLGSIVVANNHCQRASERAIQLITLSSLAEEIETSCNRSDPADAESIAFPMAPLAANERLAVLSSSTIQISIVFSSSSSRCRDLGACDKLGSIDRSIDAIATRYYHPTTRSRIVK